MGSLQQVKAHHAVLVPFPAQGHINPMLILAKLLCHRGFHVTFVNTEFNHRRLLKSRGPHSLDGIDSLEFATWMPPRTSSLSSTPQAPIVCPTSGRRLCQLGYTPLKDESYLTNGYLDTPIDWIPGMKNIRLKDLPSFIRTTDPNDILVNYLIAQVDNAKRASAIILNTFDALECDVLNPLKAMLPPVYTIGPLHSLLEDYSSYSELHKLGSNLWKEDAGCLEWLDSKDPNSVVLVNFGSITVMTADQLLEFAWGLANSEQTFLWVIRPDLVSGRSFITNWCPQEAVLNHASVGGFLTHCGWNSTLESLTAGVPLVCWPFFAEQQTNCHYCCTEWGVGLEIDSNVKRDDVEVLIRELMEGEKGKELKRKAMEWKKMAKEAAASSSGSSYKNLDALINDILLSTK